jgi:hypothetical protein
VFGKTRASRCVCDIRRSFSIHPKVIRCPWRTTRSKSPNDDYEYAMSGMNGTRVSVVVFATSFLLGASCNPPTLENAGLTPVHNPGLLFTHWIADSLTLWKPPATDERLWMSATYYAVITKAPIGFLYFFAFVAVGGGLTILLCLREGEAGNLMFDGGSICLCPQSLFRRLSC